MSEAEFERRQAALNSGAAADSSELAPPVLDPEPASRSTSLTSTATNGRTRSTRTKSAKPKRVQRMFALEEELDKKLWLYAIHVGKDRSEVINDLLRPVVASMVLYDSRDRRTGRQSDPGPDASEISND
jgi:hypothetical protein